MEGMRLGLAVKAIVVIIFASVLFHGVSASNHTVGGLSGWDFSSNLRVWSSSVSFHAGDNLVFRYGPLHDVLEVNRADFRMCRTINPIVTHNDGNTVVPLTKSGTRFFICGRRGHCAMGLRLRVLVLALPSAAPAPAPAPSNIGDGSSSNGSSSSPHPGVGRSRPPHPPRTPTAAPPCIGLPSGLDIDVPEPKGLPPQPPRSASSSSARDGGFMIMIGGWLVLLFSLLTLGSQAIFV